MSSIASAILDATTRKEFHTTPVAVNEFKIVKTKNGFAMMKLDHEALLRGTRIPDDPLAVAETVDSLVAQVRAWGEAFFPPPASPVAAEERSTNPPLPSTPAGLVGERIPVDHTVVGTFGWAVSILKTGGRVSRKGWNGRDMWLNLQVPDADSKMSLPYIYMRTADAKYVPWLASQTDMLSEDWHRV